MFREEAYHLATGIGALANALADRSPLPRDSILCLDRPPHSSSQAVGQVVCDDAPVGETKSVRPGPWFSGVEINDAHERHARLRHLRQPGASVFCRTRNSRLGDKDGSAQIYDLSNLFAERLSEIMAVAALNPPRRAGIFAIPTTSTAPFPG